MSTERGPIIWGWAAIGAAINVSDTTALAYSRVRTDPLPVRMRRGRPWCYAGYLAEWKRRREGGAGLDVLEGWAQICAALGGCDPKTAATWARRLDDPLPVMGQGSRRPWAYRSAIRDWSHRGDLPFQTHDHVSGNRARA